MLPLRIVVHPLLILISLECYSSTENNNKSKGPSYDMRSHSRLEYCTHSQDTGSKTGTISGLKSCFQS